MRFFRGVGSGNLAVRKGENEVAFHLVIAFTFR